MLDLNYSSAIQMQYAKPGYTTFPIKIKMAGLTGLEPATSCVTGKHSEPDELQPHKNGSGGEFRNPDISINSRTLCL